MSECLVKKTCSKCGEEKDADQFNKHRPECRTCRAKAQREYVARNREKVYARNKAWRDKGGRHASKCAMYGITVEDYAAMLEAQGNACAICKRPCPSGRRLAIDHCHTTGKVRGLLCARCNSGIADFQDREDLLVAAIMYLKEG